MDEAENALKRGFHVHIFPEMTRCPRGFAGTQRFHLAPFKIALELQAKIFPVVFFNTDEAWPRGSLRMNRAVTVRAKTLPPLDAKAYPTSEALLQEVQGRINAALSAGWNNGL